MKRNSQSQIDASSIGYFAWDEPSSKATAIPGYCNWGRPISSATATDPNPNWGRDSFLDIGQGDPFWHCKMSNKKDEFYENLVKEMEMTPEQIAKRKKRQDEWIAILRARKDERIAMALEDERREAEAAKKVAIWGEIVEETPLTDNEEDKVDVKARIPSLDNDPFLVKYFANKRELAERAASRASAATTAEEVNDVTMNEADQVSSYWDREIEEPIATSGKDGSQCPNRSPCWQCSLANKQLRSEEVVEVMDLED